MLCLFLKDCAIEFWASKNAFPGYILGINYNKQLNSYGEAYI